MTNIKENDLTIKTQGVRGGKWTPKSRTGQVCVRYEYGAEFLFDNYVGHGPSYRKRDEMLMYFIFSDGTRWSGTVEQLQEKLKS